MTPKSDSFYYKAGAETSARIAKFIAARDTIAKERGECFRRMGGTGNALETNYSIVGLEFDKPPGAPWVSAGYAKCYKPGGSTKEARALRKVLADAPRIPSAAEFSALLGAPAMGFHVDSKSGLLFRTINLKSAGGVFFVEVPECKTGREWTPPTDCALIKHSEFWAAMEGAEEV